MMDEHLADQVIGQVYIFILLYLYIHIYILIVSILLVQVTGCLNIITERNMTYK